MRTRLALGALIFLLGGETAWAQGCGAPAPGGSAILRPIVSTHRMPSFPYINNKQLFGNTLLDIDILPNGRIGAVNVIQSGGDRHADSDFAAYIKKNWRWLPPLSPQTCRPVEAHTTISVNFAANADSPFSGR